MKDYYIPKFSKEKSDDVFNKLRPTTSKACNNNIIWTPNQKSYSGNYYGHSLKRSNLKKCKFDNAVFDHTSFTGSVIENVVFMNNCKIESLYIEQSTLIELVFSNNLYINNSNFSHSYLENVHFINNEIRSTYFSNCYMENCKFDNCLIRSTMFDEAYLSNCKFNNCNMRNLNIEFCTMDNCTFENSCISYFQLPYIIGIFKNLNTHNSLFVGRNNLAPIPFSDYLDSIDDSIIYFTKLEEYFPLVSLYYAKNQHDIAYSCIMVGIEKSLLKNDIRMIGNFCKIGQFYDILSITDIQKILSSVDESINKQKSSNIFPLLLKQSYNLKGTILQNKSKGKLEITINTSLNENNFDEVSKLCEDIDSIILIAAPSKITTSYQLSHNSPFEICLTCIGLTANLITVSGFIYSYISKRLKSNKTISPEIQDYIEKSNKSYIESLNNQFDYFTSLIENTEKSEQTKIIKDFRGKIISSASEQINKDYSLIISQNNYK